MRIHVDLDDQQIEALDRLAKAAKRSRAELVRQAIDEYLERHIRNSQADAFGLWGNDKVDGLDYQEKMRDEW